MQLELSASDVLLAIENAEVLRKNGFDIEVEEVDEEESRRLKVVAQPVSKETVFDLKGLALPSIWIRLPLLMPSSRPGGTSSSHARSACWPDGQMFQDSCHVRIEGLSQEHYDWYPIDHTTDDISTYGTNPR